MMDDLSIDTRLGLPEHLRVLADLYPREAWRGHANFNQLTAFWLERHLMFRQVLEKITQASQSYLDDPQQPRFGPELSRYTGFMLNELQGHHSIEDSHYFPKFQAFDKRLIKAFDMLDMDHHALDEHMHNLAEATNAVLTPVSQGQAAKDQTGALLQVQEGFHRFLNRHLTDEEEVIVPVILEYGAEME